MEEEGSEKQFFLKTGQEEFAKFCSLDVLGLTDTGATEDTRIHEDFHSAAHKDFKWLL